jgi:5-methylcytosine-specific restriction endonuclease McrA
VRRVPLKLAGLQLDPRVYERLRQLCRDGSRCQRCGSLRGLQVHHKSFRSRIGADSEETLMTLRAICHKLMHR